MSLSCDVVMDLVALYQDGLASPNTQKEVAAHLWHCKKCRMQYKQYRKYYQAVSKKNHTILQPNMEQNFCMLAKKMRRRRIVTFLGVVVYMVISCSMFILLLCQRKRV